MNEITQNPKFLKGIKNQLTLLPSDFNWMGYIGLNYDLQHMNKRKAELHYVLFGKGEKRKYKFAETDKLQILNTNTVETHHFNLNTIFKKNFIINPIFGLGNRIRAIASAYSICKLNNYNLVINWVPDNHCDCYIQDLIVNIFSFAKIISFNIEDKLSNYKCYNYYEKEVNGKKDEYIDVNFDNIYVKSNCVLNNKDSFTLFDDFFCKIKFNDKINNLISKIPNISKCIGMHIRMEGGKLFQNIDADKDNNWTKKDAELLVKYRDISDIDNFIHQINCILDKNPNEKFFIATDMKSNYDKLINMYGGNIVYLDRNLFDRSNEQLYYAIADIILLSRCKQFYGSTWSSFSELVTYFQSKTIKNKNIFSNNFIKNDRKNLSIVIGHKNRINNLINSISSYINNKYVDDIVICDLDSNEDIKKKLKENIKTNFWKINVIKITTKVQYIMSYSNNIALRFAKNENILKLDADNIIVDSNSFFDNYTKYNLKTSFVHFSWKNAKTENETHVNGVFFTTKTDLKKVGYHNQNLVFYGWDDSEIKDRLKSIKKNEITLENNLLKHQEQSDLDRVINQDMNIGVNYINFFGFNIKNFKNMDIFIHYNRMLCNLKPNITSEFDVLNSIHKEKCSHRYSEYSLCLNIEKNDTNCNFLTNVKSVCYFDVFERFLKQYKDVYLNRIILKFNITNIKDKIRLFYIFHSSVNKLKNDTDFNLIFSLYNEDSISRCIELLFCLKENLNIESIKNYYILLETSKKNRYFIEEILNYLSVKYENINIIKIDTRPTFNYIFNFANKNIKGNVLFGNSDIVYNNSLDILNKLKFDEFIVITRHCINNNNDNNLELIKIENKYVNILSQDAWIFKSPMKYNLDNVLELGNFFSDSYMNYVLSKSNYKYFNLCKDIVIKQVQENESFGENIEKNSQKKNELYNKLNKNIKDFKLVGLDINTYEEYTNSKNYNNFKNWEQIEKLLK